MRGLDPIVGTYQFLDLVPKGRDEDGLKFPMAWFGTTTATSKAKRAPKNRAVQGR